MQRHRHTARFLEEGVGISKLLHVYTVARAAPLGRALCLWLIALGSVLLLGGRRNGAQYSVAHIRLLLNVVRARN